MAEGLSKPASIAASFSPAKSAPLPPLTFTLSARGKPADLPVFAFLRSQFGNLPLNQIDSLFGFVEQSTLYGGRIFSGPELSERDVYQLNNAGIGVRLPLTNHQVSRAEYEQNRSMLDRYHRNGNSIICTQDELALWIRQDFPRFRLDASVIKHLKTHSAIEQALQLYDSVVLPMYLNHETDFLRGIREKNRITLFANAGCALTCPSRICYPSISRINKYQGGEFACSQSTREREKIGMVDFDLNRLTELGFHRFKLLLSRPDGLTGF